MRNFFEHQAAARRRSFWLVSYFVLAVIATVLFVYFLVIGVFSIQAMAKAAETVSTSGTPGDVPSSLWNPALFIAVTIGVLLLVGGCTMYKVSQLSSGGKGVALLLGGSELVGQTTDLRERRLLNVVEEMAIAAGIPVPPVFVLSDEEGINAFAAGYAPGQGVVAVSRGALEYLNRDELQGVVAHEFSHILNGDMRLNIRLMAIVFGIMGLATVGIALMRSTAYRSDRKSKGAEQLLLLGIGLYIIGSAGAFFGSLIKAAVSRQREFLADASAVQFTRNPDGIGGALLKIGGLPKKSNIDNANAAEVSHMFFADGLLKARFTGLFDTHPPLDERIRRINPNWDGKFPATHAVGVSEKEKAGPQAGRLPPFGQMPTLPGLPQVPVPVLAGVDEAVSRVGTVGPDQTAYAATLLSDLPESLTDAAREPFSARALIYALLLDGNESVRQGQLLRLQTEAEPRDYAETIRLMNPVLALPTNARLPLVDLTMAALSRMSPRQYEVFRQQIQHLTDADHQVSVFEYVLRCALERHLDGRFDRPRPPLTGTTLGTESASVVAVLAHLAREGHADEVAARAAFDAGMARFHGKASATPMPPQAGFTLERFDEHLRRLYRMPHKAKRRLMLACAACIRADRTVTVREQELFRAIGDVLGCPVPTPGE